MTTDQLVFDDMIAEATLANHAAMTTYVRANAQQYTAYARAITPDLKKPRAIWERFAFAILTANTEVDVAVEALRRARIYQGLPPTALRGLSITPERAHFVNSLPLNADGLFELAQRLRGESWHEHRLRIIKAIAGLAMAKASYVLCLLYPTTAQVACLDTWMLKAFGIASKFETLSVAQYQQLETECVRIGRECTPRVCAALVQWMLWDNARRLGPNPQRFFAW